MVEIRCSLKVGVKRWNFGVGVILKMKQWSIGVGVKLEVTRWSLGVG